MKGGEVFSHLLPLVNIPVAIQHIISNSESALRRHVLVNSPNTSLDVISKMVRDKNRLVQHSALMRVNNPTLLSDTYKTGSLCCVKAVVRNTSTPTEILSSATRNSNDKVSLGAYCNPSTPIIDRLQLTTQKAWSLTNVGSFIGARVVRSYQIMDLNRHLLDDISLLSSMQRRAALSLPDLSLNQYNQIRDFGWSKFRDSHPLHRSPDGAKALSVIELLSMNSPASDLWLADNCNSDLDTCRSVLKNRGNHFVEPQVIAKLLARYGSDVVPENSRTEISGTRSISAAWLNPLAIHFNDIAKAKANRVLHDYQVVANTLSNNEEAWNSFLSLENQWDGNMLELAEASLAL